ncbi:MAG: NAD(P)/FAD-dependent oxidoreductase [Verrucomicrobiales bacterium]
MTRYDAIIIGGGPAGSTAATVLARTGRRILVLEREKFPRFHIGESLLPYNRRLFGELGLLPLIEQAGFVRKFGAQFWLGDGSRHVEVRFAEGAFNEETSAFQVERSIFDDLLLRHSEKQGAEVREGCSVNGYVVSRDGVHVQTDAGEFASKFLIDASGQANFSGNREGVKEIYSRHRKVAVFGHFTGVTVPDAEKAGDIVIVRLSEEWAWLIPLAGGKMSVGVVMDLKRVKESARAPAELFWDIVRQSSLLAEKLRPAGMIGSLRTISDYSYSNRRFVSPRLVRVGDAAAFMDPIFSSGVYLAMRSAREAAFAIEDALIRGAAMTARLRRYERWLRRSMSLYWKLIEKFYTRPFIEVFLAPDPPFKVNAAVNSVLAGRIEATWAVRWRLALFYLIVRVHERFGLPQVPRIAQS